MTKSLVVQAAAGLVSLVALGAFFGDTLTAERRAEQHDASVTETPTVRSRVHLVYDDRTNAVVRRTYSVWIDTPRKDAEFEWTAKQPSAHDPELVTGEGELVWRVASKASYDPGAVFSRYRGHMKDGRADGHGELRTRDGLRYEGTWRRGLYDGQGSLQMPDGTSYDGAFKAGKFEGEGTWIGPDNEAFTGPFVKGLRHGTGKTRLPSGASYQSVWEHGIEAADSRRVRIAQGGPFFVPMQFSPDDVRFNFQVDVWPKQVLTYAAINAPEVYRIAPDSKPLLFSLDGRGSISDGFIGAMGTMHWPIPLNVTLKNAGTTRLNVTNAYLEVETSAGELQPVFGAYYRMMSGCSPDVIDTRVLFANYGWRMPESMRFQIAFTDTPNARQGDGPHFVAAAGAGGARVTRLNTIVYDAEADLASLGVNMSLLRQHATRVAPFILPDERLPGNEARLAELLSKDGFDCQGLDDPACLAKIKQSGVLGQLAPVAYMKDGVLKTTLAGTLSYPWTNAKGVRRVGNVTFNMDLWLGARRQLCAGNEMATGPVLDPGTRTIVDFPVDRAAYRTPLPLRGAIEPGANASLGLLLRAAKTSAHRFRLVLETADGHVVRSKNISALYFTPSRDPQKFLDDPFEQRPQP